MHPLIVAGAAGMAGIMAIKALISRSSYNERLEFAKALGLQKPEQYTDLDSLNAAIEVQLKRNALLNEFKTLKKNAKRYKLTVRRPSSEVTPKSLKRLQVLLGEFEASFDRLRTARYFVEIPSMELSKSDLEKFQSWIEFHLGWSEQFYLRNKDLPADRQVNLPEVRYSPAELQAALGELNLQLERWAKTKKILFSLSAVLWFLPVLHFLF